MHEFDSLPLPPDMEHATPQQVGQWHAVFAGRAPGAPAFGYRTSAADHVPLIHITDAATVAATFGATVMGGRHLPAFKWTPQHLATALRLHTPSLARRFGLRAIYYALTNPTYLGTYAWRGRIIPNHHVAIISQSLWDATQPVVTARVATRKQRSLPTMHTHLSGLTTEFSTFFRLHRNGVAQDNVADFDAIWRGAVDSYQL